MVWGQVLAAVQRQSIYIAQLPADVPKNMRAGRGLWGTMEAALGSVGWEACRRLLAARLELEHTHKLLFAASSLERGRVQDVHSMIDHGVDAYYKQSCAVLALWWECKAHGGPIQKLKIGIMKRSLQSSLARMAARTCMQAQQCMGLQRIPTQLDQVSRRLLFSSANFPLSW